MEAHRRIKDWLSRRSAPAWESIALEEAGFAVGPKRVMWSEISSIAAFKRDLITLDDVWFQLETDQGRILICEEQPGFDNWVSELCKAFPEVATWRNAIMPPPFAENFRVLYRRT